MLKGFSKRLLSVALILLMLVSSLPMTVFANSSASVTKYSDFLNEFKQLEVYADEFAEISGKDAGELVLNFIRTGVDRYQTSTWETLAGEEIVDFTAYVEEQDSANGTTVMKLRNIVIDNFTLPNGNPADFGHMFGSMNISYVASAIQSDDISGWAGDLCDLLYYSARVGTVPSGTMEEKVDFILANYFGVDAADAFGWDDFYGDMDAYYLVREYQQGNGYFSELMENYFTASLDDTVRSAYFINNRFNGIDTREEVRNAVYDGYRTNVGIQVLEADRGISDEATLRQACCYAFADYIFDKADGYLTGDSDSGDDDSDLPANGYYSVFSSTSSILAPGITQEINYAMSVDGKQMVYYIANVDVNRDDVTIMANYKDNDPSKGWGMQRVEDQVSALVDNHSDIENFTPVVATNGDGFNTSTGKPGGLLVMEGVEWHPVDGDGFFAILKDGSAMIGTKADYEIYKDQIQEAIGAFGATLVKEGKISVNKNSSYYTSRASRTAIGIKADGSVVMMVLDGRQEPFSCGGSMEEIAQIMLEAGCVHAVNLDGGGSTTYMSKAEGSDNIKVVNRPSDGYARSVAATLVAVSTAKSSKEFDRAILKSEYDYLSIGATVKMDAVGVNNIGSSAPIPEEAYWTVSDENVGSITEDGVFIANDFGSVTVNLVLNDVVVGSKDLEVVVPDLLEFTEQKINVIYGEKVKLPLVAYYNGNEVAINPDDVYAGGEDEEAAIFEGLYMTAVEGTGVRNMLIAATLLSNEELFAVMQVSMFSEGEAVFDFDKATIGNRTLAWNRILSNTTTNDNVKYTIDDPDGDIEIDYTFALDMSAFEIPAQLNDIVYMLPGADTGNLTAFNYLLMLAERVSVLSTVTITAQFDKDLDVDISNLSVINDYFELDSVSIDEDNKITLICRWIDQTQSINASVANPVCILSGIKAKPKDNATWDGSELIISNVGQVVYDVYLRASSLYSFACKPENQAKYGLYPYSTDETGYEGGTENGAYFSQVYADFEDSFIIDNGVRQGWYKDGGKYSYYIDHKAVTGVQYIPSREDENVNLFYSFDDNGVCIGKMTGLVEFGGDLYYAINGEKTTGWISGYDNDGNSVDYYFDKTTGKAVDGVKKIDGYTYTFTNHILTRGDLVKSSDGTRYRWAGKWIHGQWFQVDGNWYTTKKYIYTVVTGFANVPSRGTPDWRWHLFDENGVFQSDYTGLYEYNGDIYYITNGLRNSTIGLVYEDGYYYYISSENAKAHKNKTMWVNHTNGLIPAGRYTFDDNGRMIDPPVVNPNPPVEPDEPIVPEYKYNGIVEIDGKLFYYENDVLKRGAGVVKLKDEKGVDFYIYVRTDGDLALGTYWITNTNGLLEGGKYDFGTNGRYYVPNVEPEKPDVPAVKDGVVCDSDGVYRYYINGVRQSGNGVVKLTDENNIVFYIYVRSNATIATGVYWPTQRNDYLPSGGYDWGTDGRYYPASVTPDPEEPDQPGSGTPDEPDVPEIKNGIYTEGGKNYYYVDGVKQKNIGVVKLSDEAGKTFYIYVRTSGELATGVYWPTNRNDLLERGPYDWGTDGRYYPAN